MKFLLVLVIILFSLPIYGIDLLISRNDTTKQSLTELDSETFYDSLHVKAARHFVTGLLYDLMYRSPRELNNRDLLSYEYYKGYENKTIASIRIKSLEVFGPDFSDTSRVTHVGIEKLANKLHTESNLNVIRKNLWIKEGQSLDPNLVMDNERLLRTLPYLKDVQFIIKPNSENNDMVDILILTKDVFSFGVTGGIGNLNKGEFGVFDNNIFGIGHEIGVNFVGHTDRLPHFGAEAYYSINNLNGNFINFTAGYANTYLRNGFYLSFGRDFLRPQSVYAGGLSVLRSFRSTQLNLNDYVVSDVPINFLSIDGWYGRRLKIGINQNDSRFQMTLSGRIKYTTFYSRPFPETYNNQYFANSTLYLASLSFSQRSYVRDFLIYSYGITEDIPKGYLHEMVFGFDKNEFGDRWYSHLYISTGDLFNYKPFYFYTSFGIGSFWKKSGFEQGMIDFKINYISQLIHIMNVDARQFLKLNYTIGINRYDVENLLLRNSNGIRGFGSRIETGKQRLSLNLENVFFLNKSILKFQTALFSFLDLGLIGTSQKVIFNNEYYAGVGVGIRIRNENLIFKTIQLRLAYYPNHPDDVSSFGFILDGVSRNRFYSFQPRGPETLRFE